MDTEISEDRIEEAGDKEARRLGGLPVKGNLRGRRDWPDKLYFFPGARLLFVEYKRRGKEARPSQSGVHRKLRRRGFQVIVPDTKAEAISAIQRFVRGETVDPEATPSP